MAGTWYGKGHARKGDIISLYAGGRRPLLQGRYLETFTAQVEGLNYIDTLDLALRLQKMQEFDPGDDLDCDCAGPNDRPGCPACAEAAREVYQEEF